MKETGTALLKILIKSFVLICVFALGLIVFNEIRDYKIQKEIDAEWKSYKKDSISPVTRSIKPDTLKK